jgi:alkyl sulfatase BDS1-like metallo-beta-lactamase superfamily hydrolase
MNTYIPDLKALWMAENVTATLHNIYTLRGAQVRDRARWSKYIAEALFLFGQEAEVMFASHHWPRWGNERIQEVLRDQRDLYANANNQVLHFANQGVTINQIHNMFELPKASCRNGIVAAIMAQPENNARGVDSTLFRVLGLQPGDADPAVSGRFGAAVCRDDGWGGADHHRPRELHDEGEYHLHRSSNKLVQAEPDNGDAKDLLADVFRADRLSAGKPRPAQLLPCRRLRAALRHPAGTTSPVPSGRT